MNKQRDDFFKRNQAAQIAAAQMQGAAVMPQARKPLTDEQIDELDLPPNGCTMRELVRAIERAHGIGGEE